MENAADALKMAGSVLLFILALSVAILSFSNARVCIDAVLRNSDREYLRIENDSRYYYVADVSSGTSRYVGKETIIPTIYRAYKENYKIIFNFKNKDYYLFEDKNGNQISKIDLREQRITSDLERRKLLNRILYGESKDIDFNNIKSFYSKSLNDIIMECFNNNGKIKEELGTYYQEDLKSDSSSDNAQEDLGETSNGILSKTEKRVITYTFE